MNKLEKLEQEAYDNDVKVHDYYLGEENLKGLYIDSHIAINTSVSNTAEKACILAEELGHHYTTAGNIINMTIDTNRKQEYRARLLAYNALIGLHGLISAYKAGCTNLMETADYLEVTAEFLDESIKCYKNKYGLSAKVDNYTILFYPTLVIIENI